MWAGEQEATIGIAAPLRDQVQSEVHHGIHRLLLRKVTIHSVILDPQVFSG
jgi:F0F1-type ATP synthase delta subunit